MKTYIFKSQEIFLRKYVYKIGLILFMMYLLLYLPLIIIFLGYLPFELFEFWIASIFIMIFYEVFVFLLYVDTKPEIPTFVIFENNMIRIITRFGKAEIPIQNIKNIIYDHKDGIFFIRLKNGNYKTLRDVRITESQRKDFEDEIRKINERGEKSG